MPKHVAPRFVMLGTQGTSHRIVKRENEPIPPEVVREQSPDPDTGLILVNKKDGSNAPAISPLVLLQAYQAVLARSPKRDDLAKRYDLVLDQLSKSEPDNLIVLSALAKRELQKRSKEANASALDYLSRAVERGSNTPQDHMLLAELLFRSNRKVEAIDVLKNAISKFPFVPTAYENLSFCYLSMGDDAHAREIVKAGLRVFPEDSNLLEIQRRLGLAP
jgi:tetratricopeptide (TPR) repeat protein